MRTVVLLVAIVGTVRADVTPEAPRLLAAASAAADPAPLLVVLHGNHETGAERAERWREAVTRRGWKLLALDCPRDLGCDAGGRWYQWNGSARWIFDQVREVAARERIDTSRVYLAGWSGGATYIGRRLTEWPRVFAAVVIHGGGAPPRTTRCPDRPFPAYFLVGDRNPAHDAAQRLRASFEDCGQQVRWDLLPGADHGAEDAALTPQKADEILRWLATQRRVDAWS